MQQSDFIAKSIAVHGDRYDYSKVEYKTNKDKVIIICKEHGEFQQSAGSHMRGFNCRKCAAVVIGDQKRHSFSQFIEKAFAVHGDLYSYERTEPFYTRISEKVPILCKEHGEFWQTPHSHTSGRQGCPECGAKASALARRLPLSEFLERATYKHYGRYDYSKVSFSTSYDTVLIGCAEHGPFYQKVYQHLFGTGCPKCGVIRRSNKTRHTTAWFIKEAQKRFGYEYDYTKTMYEASSTKVVITCRTHGDFSLLPYDHIYGVACKKCSHAEAGKARRQSYEDYVQDSRAIHGDKYEYDEESYESGKVKSKIICPVHGEFLQRPNDHKAKKAGCPDCAGTISEDAFSQFLDSLGVEVIRRDREVLAGCGPSGGNLEIDFYLPAYSLGIELNGLYWHSSAMEDSRGREWVKTHLKMKQDLCAAKDIRLLHYYDDEWVACAEIVKQQVLMALGKVQRSYHARSLQVREVEWKEAKAFYEETHLQGAGASGDTYGLYYGDSLQAAMTFSRVVSARGVKNSDEAKELIRFASKGRITGAASRLLSAYLRANPLVKNVVSYSDRRWASGDLYSKLGFSLVATTPPDYYYVSKGARRREHKSAYRLKALAAKFPEQFDPSLTERQNCHNMKFWQIYNCGLDKWSLSVG